ncbi:hypothetical protein [[Phormidium] sp. ETS-05]|uniref:hypothetical protein n=1 Tax=[Phormidium] sp. ETS-05 TaxID=222819 RepID=UPI0018EF18FB|nr:hypothetical protein [[Phormidium] sp. ETS-05]
MSLDPKIELKIQQQIRQAEDDLVKLIQDALDKKDSYGDLEESQFRNLVRVASTTESVEVIKNFLLYQVGRDKKWGRGDDSLAQNIIKDIKTPIKEKAQAISQATSNEQFKRIWLELIRRYLGYGSRYLKYIKNDGEEKKKKA